ncbi:MAG: hypothetical protein JO114_12975 [Planctomycetaceae bacterium]|nr:hypothetical protein [Planctomycetaceae bacterium]
MIPDRVITLRPPDLGAVTIEVLGPAEATPEPPSDCSIRLYTDWDRVEFVRRRAFSLLSYGFTSLYFILSYGINSICYILSILIILGWFGMFGLFGDLFGTHAFLVPARPGELLLGRYWLLSVADHPLLG